MESIGRSVVVVGLFVVGIGIVIWFWGDKLRFIGRLPGDINYQHGNTRVFIPITTMLLLSLLLSVVGWIIRRFR